MESHNTINSKAEEIIKVVIENSDEKLKIVSIDHIHPMNLWDGAFPEIGGVEAGDYTVITLRVLIPVL